MNINHYSNNEIELLAMIGFTLCHAINDGIFSITHNIEISKFKRACNLIKTIYDAQDTIRTGDYARVLHLTN
ncbi:hypothetical protein CCP4SC76_5720005 [Gammaproteobacteria bacterium]